MIDLVKLAKARLAVEHGSDDEWAERVWILLFEGEKNRRIYLARIAALDVIEQLLKCAEDPNVGDLDAWLCVDRFLTSQYRKLKS